MPTSVGPNTFGEENLVFGYDLGDYPNGWGLTQLLTNSEFTSQASPFTFGSAFTDVNYLGQYKSGSMTGNSFIFSGGDSANYSVSQPAIWGWNNGYIGSTGGNWVYANILPSVSQSAVDYIVDCKWRFHYVSRLGSGSLDPSFQIGRAYEAFFQRSFSATGNSYDWQYTKFGFNGAQGGYSTDNRFVIGLTSADSAVEIDYLRVYRIEKATGLRDLAGRSTIDLSNVSFNSSAQMIFDGTNDYVNITGATQTLFDNNESHSFSLWIKKAGNNSGNYAYVYDRYGTYRCPGLLFGLNTNTLVVEWRRSDNGTWVYNSSGLSVETGVWNFITVTIDAPGTGATKTMKVYLYTSSGLQTATMTNTADWNAGTDGSFVIGKSTSNNTYFNGEVAQVRTYSRVLTASEIKANYNAMKGRFNI